MKKNILKILKKNKIKDEEENIIVDSLEFIRIVKRIKEITCESIIEHQKEEKC